MLFSPLIYAQEEIPKDSIVDHKYRDDQIYLNASYQRLLNLPDNFSITGFSYNVAMGFIRDIPVNKARNIGFGVGLGYSINAHYFNIKENTDVPEDDPEVKELKSNKIALYMIEVPVQFRVRNSTPLKYKFFRFYPGLLFSYAFAQNHNLRQNEDFDVNEVIDINKFQYGINMSVGYNKWNFYIYYGLTDLFNETESNPYKIEAREIKLGIAIYFL
jgi:hypothetical protein